LKKPVLLKQQSNSPNFYMLIRPQRNLLDLRLRELWHSRDLIMLFVRRDFVSLYKQTILGPLWYLIQPLLTTIVFTVVFSNIARLPTDGLPPFLFYMSGTVIFAYFSTTLTKTSETFIGNANLFGKVYFSRLAVPVSILISSLIALYWLFFDQGNCGITSELVDSPDARPAPDDGRAWPWFRDHRLLRNNQI
jgi:lipopolysaccharide transport system permease protein